MMAKRQKREQKPAPVHQQVQAGESVMLSRTQDFRPWEWDVGVVLWVEGDEMVVQRDYKGRRDLCNIRDIRARGTYEKLSAIKRACAKRLRGLQREILDRENAVSDARYRLWAEIEKMEKDFARELASAPSITKATGSAL